MTFPLYSLPTILLSKILHHTFSHYSYILSLCYYIGFQLFLLHQQDELEKLQRTTAFTAIVLTAALRYIYKTNNYLAVLTRQVPHGTACTSSPLVFLCFTSGDTAIFATQTPFRQVFVIQIPKHKSLLLFLSDSNYC